MDRFGRNVFFAIPHGQPLYQYGNRLQKSLTETGINMQGTNKVAVNVFLKMLFNFTFRKQATIQTSFDLG